MIQPVNVRIDERLIHGQVAALWTKEQRINRIILIDDEVINNKMQKMLQKSACPDTIKLSIISIERAVDNFKNDKYANERSMVIVRWPETLKKLYDLNITFDEVVVGNMTNKKGYEMITNQIFVNESQKQIFKTMSNKTKFIVQLVPTSTKEDLISLL